ncbi:MAG TPA: DUF1320 domain-containing protein [Deinococcales bacterium]|nr:DUF1320 domain-containing protein [Deinococcales bacterium]
MGAYATAADLRTPARGLPAKVASGFTDDDLSTALEDASALADGYLSARFALPLTAHGPDLTSAVTRIAAYNLLVGRGFSPQPGTPDEQVRLRYEDAVKWLEGVSRGLVSPAGLVDSTPPNPEPGDLGEPLVTSRPRRGWGD